MNRTITKKWAEAKPINYDDWGEDEDDGYGDNRGYNPSQVSGQQPSVGRASFDREDERRHFTSSTAGFEGPYPTAQRNPFPELQQDQPPPSFDPRGQQPPLHLRTQSGRQSMEQQYAQGPYTAEPRGQRYDGEIHAPFSAPGAPGRRSQSSGRPSQAEIFPRNQSPFRPSSRESQGATGTRGFPPRKSSLSQQQPPMDIPSIQNQQVDEAPSAAEIKPLPFIRPADIYKRMEEERERERRSQDSSRPSFESAASRMRDNSAVRSASDSLDHPDTAGNQHVGDTESTRRARSPLEPVAERKSEYGLENIMKHSGQDAQDTTQTGMDASILASASRAEAPPPTLHPAENQLASPQAETPVPHVLPPVRGVSDFGDSFFRPETFPVSTPSGTDVKRFEPTTRETTGPVTAQGGSDPAAPPADGLHHNPSQGYRSVVHQAFDSSQDEVPPTPASTTDTVERSNSASASDISPIMTRDPESIATRAGFSSFDPQPSIPEEQHETSLPTPIVPGYRRDSLPPSRDNSPARAVHVTAAAIPEADRAVITSPDEPTMQPPVPFSSSLAEHDSEESALAPPQRPDLNERTASEDLREWEVQRKQFKSRYGIQDSQPSTPGAPSPIPRAESPSKGTVREITGKLENRSGQTSPLATEVPRPMPNPRLESFRPAIPGGWQSYATTTEASTPQQEQPAVVHAPVAVAKTVEDTDGDVPTAGPWRSRNEASTTSPAKDDGPMASAFAAAAAAGSALVGAFTGTGDEVDRTDVDAREAHGRPSHLQRHETDQTDTTVDSERPTPLPKDTPSEVDVPQSTLGYFPAPLRKMQATDAVTPSRPMIQTALSTETSPTDDENDRLRKEIVKSLTPRSSQYGGETARPFDDSNRLPPSIPDQYQPTEANREHVPDADAEQEESALPQEYDSYWNDDEAEVKEPEQSFHSHAKEAPAPLPLAAAVEAPEEVEPAPTVGLPERFSWETSTEQIKSKQPSQIFPHRVDSHVTSTSSLGDAPSSYSTQSAEPSRMESRDTEPTTAFSPGRMAPNVLAREVSTDPTSPASPSRNPGSPITVRDHRGSMSPVSPEIPAATLTAAMVPNSRPPPLQTSSTAGTSKTLPPVAPVSNNTNFINFQEVPFRDILALESSQQRIQAYNAHRQYYARSQDAELGQWLQSMGRQSEHSQMLANNGALTNDDYTALNNYRPTPPRSKFRIVSDSGSPRADPGSSGAKVQEGGKQLLHAANKYGGKAGHAAKGLLARGKDKLRTVSTGDKGLPMRRQSSQLDYDEPQHSSPSSAPPQIPAPVLTSTPITEEDPWHLYTSLGGNYKITSPSGPATPALSAASVQQRLPATRNPANDVPSSRALAVGDPGRSSSASQTISPAVSATGSVDNAALPSRSISEATQPGDSATPANTLKPVLNPRSVADSQPSTRVNAAGEAPPTQEAGSAADRSGTVNPQQPSLGLPVQSVDERRKSTASNISRPSPLLGDDSGHLQHRGVSAAAATITRPAESTPDHENGAVAKSAEAAQEPAQNESAQQRQDSLPAYQTFDGQARPVRPGRSSVVAVDPAADGAARKREGERPAHDRPFSFEGSDSAFLTSPQREQDQQESRPAPTELTPQDTRARNKPATQITVEEVQDDSDDANKPRKSYSRPFGADLSVKEHPAFRGVTEDIDRSQVFSTDSPLPVPPKVQQPAFHPRSSSLAPAAGEEQYRIPGPYVQEYRSPKQQTPQSFIGRPTAEDPEKQRPFGAQTQSLPEPPLHISTSSSMRPPSRPEAERSRRSFGGLFQSKPKSRHPDLPTMETKEKRNSLFRTQSRNDSVSSQGSRLGSLRQQPSREPVKAHIESADPSKKRRSMDLLRGISHGTSHDADDKKKRRSSAFGGLFSKKGSQQPQRAATLEPQSDQPGLVGGQQSSGHQQQTTSAPPNPRPGPTTIPGAFPDSTYYESRAQQQQQQQQKPGSAFPHGPDSIVGGRVPLDRSGYAQPPDMIQQQFQDPARFQQYTQPQPHNYIENHRSNLRIDTGADDLPRVPTTAPLVQSSPAQPRMFSRAATEPHVPQNPDVPHSYDSPFMNNPGSTAYNLPPAATTRIATSPSQSHAFNLHKRSHSPRLGRQPSTDDTIAEDAAARLGTFVKPKTTPTAEEAQEKPWRIDLPQDQDPSAENRRRAKQALIERNGSAKSPAAATSPTEGTPMTVAEKLLGAQPSRSQPGPLSRNLSAGNRGLAELPGSKAQGYESQDEDEEEEVVMSATAYPGQEWMPTDLGLGRWDD